MDIIYGTMALGNQWLKAAAAYLLIKGKLKIPSKEVLLLQAFLQNFCTLFHLHPGFRIQGLQAFLMLSCISMILADETLCLGLNNSSMS